MQIELKYLTDISIEKVQQCMQASFADYQLDMSYMTVDVMKHRNAICRNDPACSVGAFNGERMIGFINVGLDKINGQLVAFDGGTGVVKEYRGQGLTGKMFAKAVAAIKERGAKKFMLEVLQSNSSAIRAYEKEGFKISRNFKCYDISIKNYRGITKEITGVSIKQISVSKLEDIWHFVKHPVSWEHMLSGLKAVADDIIIHAAFDNNECVGFLVYTPILCWITAIGINPVYKYETKLTDYLIGQLFKNIQPVKPYVSVNNLVEEDKLNSILKELGFINPVDQYEMVSKI